MLFLMLQPVSANIYNFDSFAFAVPPMCVVDLL